MYSKKVLDRAREALDFYEKFVERRRSALQEGGDLRTYELSDEELVLYTLAMDMLGQADAIRNVVGNGLFRNVIKECPVFPHNGILSLDAGKKHIEAGRRTTTIVANALGFTDEDIAAMKKIQDTANTGIDPDKEYPFKTNEEIVAWLDEIDPELLRKLGMRVLAHSGFSRLRTSLGKKGWEERRKKEEEKYSAKIDKVDDGVR